VLSTTTDEAAVGVGLGLGVGDFVPNPTVKFTAKMIATTITATEAKTMIAIRHYRNKNRLVLSVF